MHKGLTRWTAVLCLLFLLTTLLPTGALGEAEVVSAPLTRAFEARNGMVRVYLSSLGSPTQLDVTVAGSYTADGAQDFTLTTGETIRIAFSTSTGAITMTRGGQSYDMGKEMCFRRHVTGGSNGIKIAQSRKPANLYPGDLHLIAQQSGSSYRLYTIVSVYIEYYLYGVVPYEMGNSANIEALKAQSVAARTYTLNKMNTRASSLYDVVDTTNDQVYYGNSDTTANCTAAVNATKGIVLMNGSSLTGTYYTASNGGQTESAKNAWGSSGYDYLSVKDDPFDLMNGASSVKTTTVYADFNHASQSTALKTLLNGKLEAALSAKGYATSGASIQQITSITPHTPKYASPSRLYTKVDFGVTVSCKTGEGSATTAKLTLTCDIFSELESALGMSINSSKNELWSVTKSGSDFKLQSRRYGHGIGMSQRGAMQMGALGYTYDQILGFYYDNCKRVQYTFSHTILSAITDGGSTTITTTENPADITESSGSMATVKLTSLNAQLAVRDAAADSGAVLTSVMNGSLVTVLAKGDTWTLIRIGKIVGYVRTSALSITGDVPSSSTETPTKISQWATVKCSGTLNLRGEASTSANVLTTMPSGAILCVFGTSGSWANVQYGAYAGYASMDFLSLSSTYPETMTDDTGNVAVLTEAATLRATASTTGTALKELAAGTSVTVLTGDGSWSSVTADGVTGYLPAAVLSSTGQTVIVPEVNDTPTLGSGEVEAVVRSTASSLNLRAEPSENAAVLAQMPRGESIVVTSRGETWCAVRYGTLYGYAMTQYLSFPSDEADGSTAVIGYAQVTTQSGSLNLRSQPTAGSTILTRIPRLAQVSVLANGTSWTQVTYGAYTGYVMTAYLTMIGTVTDTPTTSPDATQYATVTTASGSLNLRAEASANARVLTTIPRNTRIVITQRGETWSATSYNSVIGYVMNNFLTFEEVVTPTPVPSETTNPSATPDLSPLPDTSVTPEASASPEVSTSPVVSEAPTPSATAAPTTETALVSTGGGSLNMRVSASLSSSVMTTLAEGTRVVIINKGSIWTEVNAYGLTGFVMSQYLRTDASASNSALTATVTTASGSLNLRESASSGSKVLLRIPQKATVSVLEQGSAWTRVTYGGVTGYVMTAFLTFDRQNDATQAPNTTTTVAPTATPSAGGSQTAWVGSNVSGSLNLRASMSTDAWIITTLPIGTQVIVTQQQGAWSLVSVGGFNGYVQTAFLTWSQPSAESATVQPTATPENGTSTEIRYVTTPSGSLNLREEATTASNVLRTIPRGSAVTVLLSGNPWCRVTYAGTTGYVMTKYLSAATQSATATQPDSTMSTPAPTTPADVGDTAASTPTAATGNDATPTAVPATNTPTAAPTDVSTPAPTAAPVVPTYDATLHDAENWHAAIASDIMSLNLRAWCSTEATLIAEMLPGEVVDVLQLGDTWCKIKYKELEGYCMSDYLVLWEVTP